jgi:GntR family transcriptional regulator
MSIQLDFRSGLPIYIQITERIRAMVASGKLQPGDQLPTVRQMATDLRVNFNTVARAYRLLDETGLISTQQGRGTYIWQLPDERAAQKLKSEALDALAARYAQEASRLGFTHDDARQALAKQWKNSPEQRKESEEE